MEKGVRDIYFAGGCFWGVEEFFSRLPGVVGVTCGYANGRSLNPTYGEVCSGATGHAETVHVRYDPAAVSLTDLIEGFFRIIDPVSLNRQGNDVGTQYRTGIYYADERDRPVIEEAMRREQEKHDLPLAVEAGPLENYSLAEEAHQKYLKKHPGGYCHIDLEKALRPPAAYQRPSDTELKERLSPLAYEIVRHGATEPAFSGAYWNHKERGLYVDAASGEPLFSSSDKFDSGSGWPSFTRAIQPNAVTAHADNSFGMQRVEIRSRIGDSHLGHVFNDGPRERGGLRFCINSAALRFVPYEEMESAGYGAWKEKVKQEKPTIHEK